MLSNLTCVRACSYSCSWPDRRVRVVDKLALLCGLGTETFAWTSTNGLETVGVRHCLGQWVAKVARPALMSSAARRTSAVTLSWICSGVLVAFMCRRRLWN